MVVLIWFYTRRGGIKTLVWTDTFQTTCMFAALILIIFQVISSLHLTAGEAVWVIAADAHSQIFEMSDWVSRQNFWKQFLSGIFVVIVMTGLDQDMMQKNLTCKSLRDAQKDMCTYGFAFVPANLLFLSLGVLLMMLVLFTIGVVAASFSSADSALTALTTSFCVDICNKGKSERLRKRVHIGMSLLFMLFILAFKVLNSTSVIDAIYILCSYTYGPLLGLFAFSLFTKRQVNNKLVPYICIVSPLLCFSLDIIISHFYGYTFGYELLMLNGALTFIGLWLSGSKYNRPCKNQV